MRTWRFWLFWLLVAALIWFVSQNFVQVQHLAQTLSLGKWQWLVFAALVQVIYYLCFTWIYQSAFDTVEVESSVRGLIPVVLSSLFLNVVTPTAGASGAALFIDDADQRGQSPTRAAAGTLLALVADFSSFTVILLAGLIILFIKHDLQAYEIIAAIVLLLISGGMVAVLSLGLWNPNLLRGLLKFVQSLASRMFGWLKRPSPLTADWYETTTTEFVAAGAAIHSHPDRLGRTLAIALVAQLVDIASIYFIFLAFGWQIGFGVLVAGFAVGVLFWIVSITPQGIGVVEGVMALTYSSLGVPATIATAVALVFRGLTFWFPLVLGFFMLRRTKSFQGALKLPQDWGLQMVSLLTALMGLVNVFSAVTPSLAARVRILEQFSPLEVRIGSHLSAAIAGFALLLLASGLRRSKRSAWLLTLVVLVISILSHLLKGLDYEEALLAGLLALWLVILAPRFKAQSDPPSVRQGLLALIAALGFTLFYGTLGFYLLDRHFQINFGLLPALRQTLIMFTQFYDPGLQPITGFGRYFAGSIYAVGGVTFLYAMLMLASPVIVRQKAPPSERARAGQIVEQYGRTSLARATLFDDKLYHFSPGGSVIAYRYHSRVAIALGDPIGPVDDLILAIRSYQDMCMHNDWLPAFYQTQPDTLGAYQAAGFDSLQIGDEAIVDLTTFSLEGHANKTLRSGYNRLVKLNYHTQVYPPPLTDELMNALSDISNEWLTSIHGREKALLTGLVQ